MQTWGLWLHTARELGRGLFPRSLGRARQPAAVCVDSQRSVFLEEETGRASGQEVDPWKPQNEFRVQLRAAAHDYLHKRPRFRKYQKNGEKS